MTDFDNISAEGLAALEAAVAAQPGVTDVAAVVRWQARPAQAGPRVTAEAPAGAAGADPAPAGPPAEVAGAELPDDPSAPATFGAALDRAAAEASGRGMTYLASDGTERFQSFAELRAEAARVLGALRTAGVAPGDPVVFQCSAKRNVVVAFWACALGGFVATPVSVLLEYGQDNAGTRKLRAIWDLLDRPLVLTEECLAADTRDLGARWTGAPVRMLTMERALLADTAEPREADPGEAVLHLLTSGSTGVPKCVRHTHRSLLARIRSAALHNGFTADDTSLSWMPIDHVGGWLYNASAAVHRNNHVNAEMDAFLADPLRWMDWVHRFRVANVWTPNFALSLVNEHASEMAGRDWDLSCLRHICSGGEAVVSPVVHRFSQLLRPFGLPDRAVHPSFGMSEVSAGVTYTAMDGRDESVGVLRVDKDSLSGRLRFDGPAWRQTAFTELGGPIPGVCLRIVDEDGRVLPEDHVGRLQISGVTLMQGYHRNDEANAASFTADGWFDSRDLGFLHHGSLTLTGRDGDMIIVQGANFFSHDIEAVVEQVPGTEVSFVAAVADRGAGTGADQLIVFFAPVDEGVERLRTTISGIRARMVQELGITPDRVVPVPRARFPKTEIGKIQRRLLIKQLHDGAFDETLRAVADDGAQEPGSTLFAPVWTTVPARPDPAPVGVWVVHEGVHTSLAEQLRPVLPTGAQIVVTRPGESFARAGAEEFTVPPTDRVAHGRLLGAVTELGPVVAVLHAGNLERAAALSDVDGLAGFFSARAVLQALAACSGPKPALLVLTTGSLAVADDDRADLAKVALPGLIRTAVAEAALPVVRLVDLPPAEPATWAAAIAAELGTADEEVVAYRDGRRWARRLRSANPPADSRPNLATGGLYLVTGGLGGIAYEVAQYLLAAYGVRLLLINRFAVAPDSKRGRRLDDLRGLGEVLHRAVDVADATALEAAVHDAEQHWNQPLAGVLHLAGATERRGGDLERSTVSHEPDSAFVTAMHAKVFGTLAVARILERRPTADLILFSSVNGDFGGGSFGAYSSANSFLGGFAEHWSRERGRRVWCLSWSMWAGVGMSDSALAPAAESRGFRALAVEDALDSLLGALAIPGGHLIIGLNAGNRHILREIIAEELYAAEVIVAYSTTTDEPLSANTLQGPTLSLPVPVRLEAVPELPRDADGRVDRAQLLANLQPSAARRHYVAPRPGFEQRLADIWAHVLCRAQIGRDDIFFDLGGSSLRATQLVNRINDEMRVDLRLHQLYAAPTVGKLAEFLTPGTVGD